mgnify:FL=1
MVVLEKLIADGFAPTCVVCNPDRPVGRKKVITQPPTKLLAKKNGIKVWQPEKLEIGNWKSEVGEIDFAIVAAYSKIIPKGIIEIPKLGVIGVHPSLLPKYRGASPIQSAILRGDEKTGVTLFLIDEKVDHGPVLAQAKVTGHGSGIKYAELQKQLAELAGDLLVEMLPKFLAGEITPQSQNDEGATYTKKFLSEDARIEPGDLERALSGENPGLAQSIDRKIRALNPEPGVWTMKDGKRMKLLEAEIADGRLRLKRIQIEGKKPQAMK